MCYVLSLLPYTYSKDTHCISVCQAIVIHVNHTDLEEMLLDNKYHTCEDSFH